MNIQVGGNLNIESLQDTENYNEKNTGVSVGISGGAGGMGVSGGVSQQKIDSEYQSNQEQTGIYAGDGGFDIHVEGNTDLKGAVIASEADAENNQLSTGTLTYSDLENHAEYEANTIGVNINTSFENGKKTGEKQEESEKTTTQNKDKGVTPNLAGSDGKASSTTHSAIAEGEIEVRDNPDQDISDLSRDTENANNPLDKIFDRDKILEKQEAAAVFGEIGFTIVGNIIKHNNWDNNDPRAIALHAIVGGVMSEINGGSFGDGMTTAAINKLLVTELKKQGVSGEDLRWASAMLGMALDGNQGASIADSATANNAKGWYLNFGGGKKGIAGAFTIMAVDDDENGETQWFLSGAAGLGGGVLPVDLSTGMLWTKHYLDSDALVDYFSGTGTTVSGGLFLGGGYSVTDNEFAGTKGKVYYLGMHTNASISDVWGYTSFLGKGQDGYNNLLERLGWNSLW